MTARPAIVVLWCLVVAHLLAACGAAPSSVEEQSNSKVHDRQRVDEEKALIESMSNRATSPQYDGAATGGLTCADVCNISVEICRSSETICAIADRHANEVAYADDCRWATSMCEGAARDCNRCGGQSD